MHGSAEEIEADKKRKQRAVAYTNQMPPMRKLTDVTKHSKEVTAKASKSGVLNSTQSAELTRDLEARQQFNNDNQKYTSTGTGPRSSSGALNELEYKSNFGKNYVKNQ